MFLYALYFFFILINQAIAAHNEFETHFTTAHQLFIQCKYQEALAEYDASIALQPECCQAYYNKGLVYTAMGDKQQAMRSYEQAITINEHYVKPFLMLGDLYKQNNDYHQAHICFKKVLHLEPNNIEAHVNIAKVYTDMHDLVQATYHIQQALTLNPHEPNILLDYANVLTMNNNMDEALATYHKILDITPNNPSILYNIGYTLKKKGLVKESLTYYYKSLQAVPDNPETHFGLALALLSLGLFDEGWKEYEWRLQRDGFVPRLHSHQQWQGEPLAGKTLFIHAEQGLGDTLQFIRYAQELHKQGATIIAAVQHPLVTLLSRCPYLNLVINLEDNVPSFDYHISLMSLPHICKTRLDTIPTTIPYLYTDSRLSAYWKDSLAQDPNIKIGICWQGNPNYSTPFLRHAVAAKSLPLAAFAPIAHIPGVSLYSLQKISGTDQLSHLGNRFVIHQFDDNFDQQHGRFMDTAAVMQHLDLVITVDTSIAHLAGALGVPTWLILPNPADWRWMLDRNDTPWYSTMRIFRQPKPGDWESVMLTIAQELQQNITYCETNSIHTRLVDQASLCYLQAAHLEKPATQQALRSYAQSLTHQIFSEQQSFQVNSAVNDLIEVNQALLACNQELIQQHPFHENYTRLIQQAFFLVQQREKLKQTINNATH